MCTWCASFSMSTTYDRRRELDIQDIHVRSSGTNFLQGRVRRTPQSVVELPDDGREGALVEIVRSLGEGHAGGSQLLAKNTGRCTRGGIFNSKQISRSSQLRGVIARLKIAAALESGDATLALKNCFAPPPSSGLTRCLSRQPSSSPFACVRQPDPLSGDSARHL